MQQLYMTQHVYICIYIHTNSLTQTTDTFGASALMITSYVCHMFKVLIQSYTTCEGCMVIDAAGTKYKLNSKECWSNSRQCVWCMCTDCSGLVQHSTH